MGCRLWGGTESDTTEATQQQQQQQQQQQHVYINPKLLIYFPSDPKQASDFTTETYVQDHKYVLSC